MVKRTALAVFIAAWYCGVASADPIVITSAFRVSSATASIPSELPEGPSDFDTSLATSSSVGHFPSDDEATAEVVGNLATARSSQNTTIDPRLAHWFGSGSSGALTFGNALLIGAEGRSTLDLDFVISERTPYRFTGTFFSSGAPVSSSVAGAGASLSVFLDSRTNVWSEHIRAGTGLASHTGLLLPGNYSFEVFAISHSGLDARNTSMDATFDFDFELGSVAPIPEPTTGALVASGLVAGAYGRWRRRITQRKSCT